MTRRVKNLINRKQELLKLFAALQQCRGTSIDPKKHNVLTQHAILNVDIQTMTKVRKEVAKLLEYDECTAFSHQELEQGLLESAAFCLDTNRRQQENAPAATEAFFRYVSRARRKYLVPFVTSGFRIENPSHTLPGLIIGSCEFCADTKRLKEVFSAIRVQVRSQASAKHTFPDKGTLVVPVDQTIAVVEVETSSGFASVEAYARLEEAYGFFVLHYDAVSGSREPGGSLTRMPLVSWQSRPALVPVCSVAMEPIDLEFHAPVSDGTRSIVAPRIQR